MAKNLKKGDRVQWNSHGSKAKGEVVRKITSDTKAAGRQVRASKDDPQYEVATAGGGTAVHKPESLEKLD